MSDQHQKAQTRQAKLSIKKDNNSDKQASKKIKQQLQDNQDDFQSINNLNTFYVIITPEQDAKGVIILNRKTDVVRTWYYCSQQYNKDIQDDNKVIKIINDARNVALVEAWSDCGFEDEFKIARPKSCNENTARKYMTNKLVIVLDNFDLNEMTCDIHSGLICRNIDDDPRIWKTVKWGKKLERIQRKKRFHNRNTLADVMPDKLKAIGNNQ